MNKNGICQKHGFYKGKCLKCMREYDKRRPNANFYNSSKWRKLRLIQLRTYPTCAMCGRIATIADHIHEINNGGARYDLENLQSLCLPCHNSKTSAKKITPQGGGL